MKKPGFIAGVVEGFYGTPWEPEQRRRLFERMAALGLNAYFYAPKDDLKHRVLWREPYEGREVETMGELIAACKAQGLRFIYGLSPGLDARFEEEDEAARAEARFRQLRELGCEDFALLFDDLPEQPDGPEPPARLQARFANRILERTRPLSPQGLFLFCPTAYCGRMAAAGVGGKGYLDLLGRELHPTIEILWTGPEIISPEIPTQHVKETARRLRRPPVIWDNLFANDYDGSRMCLGPYSGRPLDLRRETRGILINPNTEFELNFAPLHTFAAYLREEVDWSPRAAYLEAMRRWSEAFETVGAPIAPEDLAFLGDCYYLPHREGPAGERLIELARRLTGPRSPDWEAAAEEFLQWNQRAQRLSERLPALRRRRLFYDLWRRAWEWREELRLWELYIRFRRSRPPEAPFRSEEHPPGIYRGGFVNRLRRLLLPREDGSFVPGAPEN